MKKILVFSLVVFNYLVSLGQQEAEPIGHAVDFYDTIRFRKSFITPSGDTCQLMVVNDSICVVCNSLDTLRISNVNVSDLAYNATSWNGNTDAATKNAIRDKIETLVNRTELGDTASAVEARANIYTDNLDSINGNFYAAGNLTIGGNFTSQAPFYIYNKTKISQDTAFYFDWDTSNVIILNHYNSDYADNNNPVAQWVWQVGKTSPLAVALFNVHFDNSGGNYGGYMYWKLRNTDDGLLRNRMRMGGSGYLRLGNHVTSNGSERLQIDDGNLFINGGYFKFGSDTISSMTVHNADSVSITINGNVYKLRK